MGHSVNPHTSGRSVPCDEIVRDDLEERCPSDDRLLHYQEHHRLPAAGEYCNMIVI